MKTIVRIAMALVLAFTMQHISTFAQDQETVDGRPVPILSDRIPMLSPGPCTNMLVDFGSTRNEVEKAAGEINLKFVDSVKHTNDTLTYVLEWADPTNENIVYGTIHRTKDGVYVGTMLFIRFAEPGEAATKFESITDLMISDWSMHRDSKRMAKTGQCREDGSRRNISATKRDNKLLVRILCVDLPIVHGNGRF